MNIGILTFYNADNYGAVLQAYALCRYLNSMYGETELIDYTPLFMYGRYNVIKLDTSSIPRFVKSFVSSVYHFPLNFIKKVRFTSFRVKNCKTSREKYNGIIERDNYDYYIVGSDQVFNLKLTKNDLNFFLPFVEDDSKKYTYAASLADTNVDDLQKSQLKFYLSEFRSLSVRESSGVSYVKSLIQRDVWNNIDPVFLLPKKVWGELASRRLIKDKYVLIYSFEHFEQCYKIAQSLNNLKIVVINNSIRKLKKDVKNVAGVGPKEFISLIMNADYVVTDSFHGTAFSIIFHKNFYVIPYKNTSSRMSDLLDKFQLSNRMLTEDNVKTQCDIDYTSIDNLIESEQQHSKRYFDHVFNQNK